MHTSRRHYPAAALLAAICAVFACQSSPTESGGQPESQIDSLSIDAPSGLLVAQPALISVQVWKDQNPVHSPITWSLSDPSIASVRSAGSNFATVTPTQRGTVTVFASAEGVVGRASIRITAELRIQSDYLLAATNPVQVALGDQLQFESVYVDANGQVIPEKPAVTWSSTDPAGVSVSPAGLVVAAQASHTAIVTATSPDDTARVRIHVNDVLAGQPATLRIVHGVPGLGPIRFVVNRGAPLTLSFGQSAELPIVSGILAVTTDGMPPGNPVSGDLGGKFAGLVHPGDHLGLYAVGSSDGAFLQPAWPSTASISPGSGLVRLIQSSTALVVYLRPNGAPISGLPELCYFDPGVVSDYFVRPPGDFDIIGQDKYDSQQEIGRAAGSVTAGHAVTMVLTGGGKQPLSVLTFNDR
jgi:hypothetical protein